MRKIEAWSNHNDIKFVEAFKIANLETQEFIHQIMGETDDV